MCKEKVSLRFIFIINIIGLIVVAALMVVLTWAYLTYDVAYYVTKAGMLKNTPLKISCSIRSF